MIIELDNSKIRRMEKVKTIGNFYFYKKSKYKIRLPNKMTKDLAYLIGVIYGDGSIHKPIRRKKGGDHKKITISCRKNFIDHVSPIIENTFNYKPLIYKDKRKQDTYHIIIQASVIYHFFTDTIGFRPGKKSGNLPQLKILEYDKSIFRHFVAGFFDTDGYVSDKYTCLVQKDKFYLDELKIKMRKILDLNFNGPYVNRRINKIPVGWWITNRNTKEVLNKIPLRYKGRVAQLG